MSESKRYVVTFEVISEDEFRQETSKPEKPKRISKAREPDTSDRTLTGWWKLPSFQDFCTVPAHDDIQSEISEDGKVYRQLYPTRMVIKIGEFQVCRDCYVREADIHGQG